MCGIAGIFSRDNDEIECSEQLRTMANLQSHRGPDNLAVQLFPGAGFSHNRLSLLDLSSKGHQPMYDDNYVLVYNGEIYNWQELRGELQRQYSIPFKSNCDTEVLFRLLIHLGTRETVSRLQGMFAFAFYDIRRRCLILARDRVGIKPLFYYLKNDKVYFSSELKTLVKVLNPPVSEHRILHSALGTLETSRCLTAFDDTHQVEPGTLVTFSDSGWHVKDAWFHTADLIDPAYYQHLDQLSTNQVVAEFRRLLLQSVEKMLVADASIGAFVSGGIDSSLISVLARECGKKPRLYSVNVVGPLSEIDSARLLASELDSQLFEYEFQPDYFIRDWVRASWHYDVPLVTHQHAVPFCNLTELAHRQNDKAVLTGEGADEMFFGYAPEVRASVTKRFTAFARYFDALLRKLPIIGRHRKRDPAKFFAELRSVESHFEADIRRERYQKALEFLPTQRLRDLQQSSLELTDTTLHSLLWRNDRMGMMNSIESRFPYLDEAVLRFGANLPVKFKVGWTRKSIHKGHPFLMDKYVIRMLAEKNLPPTLYRKRKHPFTIYGFKQMKTDWKVFLGGFLQEHLRLSSKELELMIRYLSPQFIARLVGVDIWGRMYIQNESVGDVTSLIQRHCSINQR